MKQTLVRIRNILYRTYGLDEATAQDHFITCDSTFESLNANASGDDCKRVLDYLISLLDSCTPSLEELQSLLQNKFQFYDVDIDFGKRLVDLDLQLDRNQIPTLHVEFRRYVHWDPKRLTFYLSSDQEGSLYLYSPCTGMSQSIIPSVRAIIYVLNCLTTIMNAGVKHEAIFNNANIIHEFMSAIPDIDKDLIGEVFDQINKYSHSRSVEGLIVDMADDDRVQLIAIDGKPVAAITPSGLYAEAVCNPSPNVFRRAKCYVQTITESPSSIMQLAIYEYVLSLIGIRTYWDSFQWLKEPAIKNYQPIHFNIPDIISSYQELENMVVSN